LTEEDLLGYAQFLQSVSHLVILDPQFRAPLRDPTDLIVLQTAEQGEADFLCTHDADFYDPKILSYCTRAASKYVMSLDFLSAWHGAASLSRDRGSYLTSMFDRNYIPL
jgi:hypothetical protein